MAHRNSSLCVRWFLCNLLHFVQLVWPVYKHFWISMTVCFPVCLGMELVKHYPLCDLHSTPSSQQSAESAIGEKSFLEKQVNLLQFRRWVDSWKVRVYLFSPSFLKSSWVVWPHVEKVSLKGCRCGDSREEVHFINSSPTFFSLLLFLTQTLFSHFFQSCYWFSKKNYQSICFFPTFILPFLSTYSTPSQNILCLICLLMENLKGDKMPKLKSLTTFSPFVCS